MRGSDESQLLKEAYAAYFVTSHGDRAANRLGDLHFQRGNLGQAAACWQSILDHHPNSRLSAARLHVKRGIALVRAGRIHDAAEVQRVLSRRYADESVNMGGRQVNAQQHLAELITQHGQPKAAEDDLLSTRSPGLPKTSKPLWSVSLLPKKEKGKPPKDDHDHRHSHDVPEGLASVPPITIDGRRCYFAIEQKLHAIDLDTGKSIWNEPAKPAATKRSVASIVAEILVGEIRMLPRDDSERIRAYASIAAFDRWVFCTNYDPDYDSDYDKGDYDSDSDGQAGLICRDAFSGKVLWNSATIKDLKGWNFHGAPVMGSGRLLIVATKQDKPSDLGILSIRPSDGKLLRTTRLGMIQTQDNPYGSSVSSTNPSLLVHRDKLFVDTHAGGLIQIDCESGAVDWGFSYPTATSDYNPFWGGWGHSLPSLVAHNLPPVVRGDRIFFKPTSSATVFAIDLTGPSIRWQREVDPLSDGLVDFDEHSFTADGKTYQSSMLIAGAQYNLYGLDMSSGTPQWDLVYHNQNVPQGPASSSPVVQGDHVYRFTNLGIYALDKFDSLNRISATGFQSNDPHENGGQVFFRKGKLITVTDRAITAYVLPSNSNIKPRADLGRKQIPRKKSL